MFFLEDETCHPWFPCNSFVVYSNQFSFSRLVYLAVQSSVLVKHSHKTATFDFESASHSHHRSTYLASEWTTRSSHCSRGCALLNTFILSSVITLFCRCWVWGNAYCWNNFLVHTFPDKEAVRHWPGSVFVNLVGDQRKILPWEDWSGLCLEDTQMMHCLCDMIRAKEAWRSGKWRQSLRVNQLETKLKWAFETWRLESMANSGKKDFSLFFVA